MSRNLGCKDRDSFERMNSLGESEAWKGLRTAVTSLAPAGRGVWGPGTQKPQGTYAFVRFHLTSYHSKKQKILDS